jgi:hypothetical protein
MKPAGLVGQKVCEEVIDTGGMFDSYEGVVITPGGKFRAYITNGWGGGWAGWHLDTKEEALRDIERGRRLVGSY